MHHGEKKPGLTFIILTENCSREKFIMIHKRMFDIFYPLH